MEYFKNRRLLLSEELENGDMIIVVANSQPDGISKFIQNNNFLYLTGLETPEAKLVIYKNNDIVKEILFIEENIPERIVWDGEKIYPKDATEISGVDDVRFLSSFYSYLELSLIKTELVYMNYGHPKFDKPKNSCQLLADKIKDYFPHVMFEEITPLMKLLRVYKEDIEIENMKKAIDITGEGFMEILTRSKIGDMEYQLESMLQNKMLMNGIRNFGFAPIIAAGKNAATLHYVDNDTEIKDGDLILCDIGAAYNNYSADIARTFPISGKFTKRQKAVYEKVLHVQKMIISMIKPGVSFVELNSKADELITDALIDLKLITEREDYKKYYMHSIGHHLGMDTHDLGERDSELEEGNVITVEPGIYIPEESIGVRIEDDVLVTEDGYLILSSNIPKEIKEIEKIRLDAIKKM